MYEPLSILVVMMSGMLYSGLGLGALNGTLTGSDEEISNCTAPLGPTPMEANVMSAPTSAPEEYKADLHRQS